jgi:hypothetical protein
MDGLHGVGLSMADKRGDPVQCHHRGQPPEPKKDAQQRTYQEECTYACHGHALFQPKRTEDAAFGRGNALGTLPVPVHPALRRAPPL